MTPTARVRTALALLALGLAPALGGCGGGTPGQLPPEAAEKARQEADLQNQMARDRALKGQATPAK